MANVNCSSCEEIRQVDPNLIVNGFGDTECSSLQNNTGLSPSSGNDDCTDLNNLNDCLVGNQEAEVDLYEVCDWKKFMKQFIPNLWTTLKAIICAVCGIWTRVKKLECIVSYMGSGSTFHIGEEPSDGSYVVAGKGVSFYQTGQDVWSGDVNINYVAGGFARVNGSCIFHYSDFTDAKAVVNFDNGAVERTSRARLGNPRWDTTGKIVNGGELVYEIRVKKSQYPQLKGLTGGFGLEGAGGAYHVKVISFDSGRYAYGQHGWCSVVDGTPFDSSMDRGHLVPDGWIYLQVRISYLDLKLYDNAQYTPDCICGVRLNQNAIDC